MNGALIRNIIIAALLVVISFVIGSEAAEDAESAGMIIGAFVGGFAFLTLGKNCWWLIFLLPPVISQFPLGVIDKFPVCYAVAGAVLIYWTIMRFIGRVHFTWRSLAVIDIPVYLLFIYSALTYYWNPVILGMFSDAFDENVGGGFYVWAAVTPIYYVAMSCIPCSWAQLQKVMKWAVICTAVVSVLSFYRSFDVDSIATNAMTSRFAMFSGISTTIFLWICCRYKLTQILVSPWKVCAMGASTFGVLLAGFRENMMFLASYLIASSLIYKRFILLLLLAASVYGGLLYLGSEDMLLNLPMGVQRTLRIFPGVKIDEQIAREADGSSEWRKVMWRWAFDPRTGYIKDYVWGDGWAQDVHDMQRWDTQLWRGRARAGNQEMFASRGTWHNGVVMTIHRMGIVCVVLISLFWLCGYLHVWYLCSRLRGQPVLPYVMFMLLNSAPLFFKYYVSAGAPHQAFMAIQYFALAKVLHIEALRAGVIKPFSWRQPYVPMSVRVLENPQQA